MCRARPGERAAARKKPERKKKPGQRRLVSAPTWFCLSRRRADGAGAESQRFPAVGAEGGQKPSDPEQTALAAGTAIEEKCLDIPEDQ